MRKLHYKHQISRFSQESHPRLFITSVLNKQLRLLNLPIVKVVVGFPLGYEYASGQVFVKKAGSNEVKLIVINPDGLLIPELYGVIFHEVGHYFRNYYEDAIFSHEDFCAHFGEVPKDTLERQVEHIMALDNFMEILNYWKGIGFEGVQPPKSHISYYAESHPEEDFAECFKAVMYSLVFNKTIESKNLDDKVNAKLKFVFEMIKTAVEL